MTYLTDLHAPQPRALHGDTATILIVDDEPRFRAALGELLRGPERQIQECATGKEAVTRLNRRDVDVVVLDLKLPDIDGMEIMEWLAASGIATSVIVFSGDSAIDAAIQALRQGAFEFIRKHDDPEQLVAAVNRALRRRRMEAEHAQMAARLEQSERMHRFLVENSPDLIYTLDSQGRFQYANKRFETLLGYSPEELIGQHYSVILHEEDIDYVRYAFNERRVGERATFNFELRLKTKQNAVRNFDNRMIITILSSQGLYKSEANGPEFRGTAGVARDITDRKRAEETIAFQAFHDLLTGLPNRILFLDRLSLSITQAQRRQERLGILYLDVDRFKLINDTYGHPVGDKLLQEFAQRVSACLRSGDTLARQGGDEFTILLPAIGSAEDVANIANKILASLRDPIRVAEHDFLATASIGFALYPDDGTAPEDLIKKADIAMYQAKGQGKNASVKFHSTMNTTHVERISLENDLVAALKDCRQLELYYQPQVSVSRRAVTGLEALIRWRHPTRGMISPDAFIPLAEESGLIVAISDWVLDTGCQRLAELRARGHTDLKLGINLSPREFDRNDLVERVTGALGRYGIPHDRVEIELTENLLVKDTENIIGKIRQLRASGIHIAIDDFGTRYSSLNYLRRLSINGIKIDKSFVHEMSFGTARDATAIVRAIFAIAQSFDLNVTVEGVEEPDQLRTLTRMGGDTVQGYYFSPALPSSHLEDYIDEFPQLYEMLAVH